MRRASLSDVHLALQAGEVHGLLGGNGTGKTTLAKVIVGLIKPHRGTVSVAGRDVTASRAIDRAETVGTAFQNPDEMLSERTVRDELTFALRRRRYERTGLFGKRERYDEEYIAERVRTACDLVGLDEDLLDQDPTLLPFGWRKLLTIAAAVVRDPAVLVLDEPGTGLDVASHGNVARVVRRLSDRGVAVVLVEHEMDLVGELTDSVTVMADGAVVEQGPTRAVFDPDNWDRLLDSSILPPRAARLGHAVGVTALSLDDLAAAFVQEAV